jgi:cysteinyl-tRNA synthetase
MIQVYNDLNRKKEAFVPLSGNKVGMYVCGPTVYDFFHIGNARAFTMFDIIRRYLEYRGYDVTYVQNFTDIDDKMINRARDLGITVKELAERYIDEYFQDADALGVRRADHHPKATEHIPEIIDIVVKLQEKGFAYEVDGDVYFDAKRFEEYGKLSHQDLGELESGSRVDVDERKINPIDFALWKKQKPGEPAWDSPWGQGRPGWHIECSAMAAKYLGETIDIHAGGADLVFPHHENEIAQSEAANEKPFARYWLHNGYLNIDGEKMSKSLGNFFTVRDIRKVYDPEVVRFFLMSAHYRNPLNFSEEQLASAKIALERLYTTLANLEYAKTSAGGDEKPGDGVMTAKIDAYRQQFIDAMDDDFNTADATAVMFMFAREVNTQLSAGLSVPVMEKTMEQLKEWGQILGLLQRKSEASVLDDAVEDLIKQRDAARKGKNWAEADRIRAQLSEMGITIEDTPKGARIIARKN